jgi:hypothetical protein
LHQEEIGKMNVRMDDALEYQNDPFHEICQGEHTYHIFPNLSPRQVKEDSLIRKKWLD